MNIKEHDLYKKHEKYLTWTRQEVPLNDFSDLKNLEKIDYEFEKTPVFKALTEVKFIVIHHAEIDSGNRDYYNWLHKAYFGWDAVGYHFIIGNGVNNLSTDGEIEIGRELKYQGAHVKNENHNSIGICLTGNLDNYRATEKQYSSLIRLVKDLMNTYNVDVQNIVGHRDFDGVTKTCPGKMFDLSEFRNILK
jgi:N-acetylmuramoyl-L-alanine amidase